MSLLMPVAVALLVSAQPPLSTRLALPTGQPVELVADDVSSTSESRVFTARGHAVLSSGPLRLRADTLTYDQDGATAVAHGNVLLVDGLMAAVAEEVRVDLSTFEVSLEGGLLMQKRGVTTEQLLQAQTPQELRDLGQTPVLLSGRHITRTGPNEYQVEGIALAPCLCEAGPPSWRIEASRASVDLGHHATLAWPVVYVGAIPVFAAPWLYMPLATDRRTGLLIPRPTSSGLNGFSLEQPVFITLGRSYDLTLTPAFYVGAADVLNVARQRKEPPRNGVSGPRLSTEFRYVPAVGTDGRATLGLLYDGRPVRNPVTGDYFVTDAGDLIRAPRGLRGDMSLQHRQDLGNGWYDRVDAFAVSDGFYTRDVTADIVARENQYLRSSGVLYHRAEDQWVGLEVSLRQDIRYGYDLFGRDRVPEGAAAGTAFTPAPRPFQKLPALSWVLAERPLGDSPLVGAMRVEFTRLSPLLSRFGDEGLDGRFSADGLMTVAGLPVPDTAQGNGIFDGLDREARDRVDMLPRLSSSFALGPFARVSPALSLRQDFYVGELSGHSAQRGYPILDLVLDSRLSRTFAVGGGTWRHALQPSVTLRYVPTVWGGLPSPGTGVAGAPQPYDEVDTALPLSSQGLGQRFLHAVLAVDQSLISTKGASRQELLRLTVGQGFDLTRYTPSLGGDEVEPTHRSRDLFGRLSLRVNRFSGNGVLRYDPNTRQIAQLGADFRVDVPRGSLSVRYDNLESVGSDRLRRGLDALVGPALTPAQQAGVQRAQQLTAGVQTTLGRGFGVRYETLVQPQARGDSPLGQQTLGVSYAPACNCWRVEGLARLARGQARPDFGLNLTVTGVGTFGTGG